MIMGLGVTWRTYQDEKREPRVNKMRIQEHFISSLKSIVIQVLDDVERRTTAPLLGQGIKSCNSIDGKSITSTSLPI